MELTNQQLVDHLFNPLRASFSSPRPDGSIILALLDDSDSTVYSRVLAKPQIADQNAFAQSLEEIRLELGRTRRQHSCRPAQDAQGAGQRAELPHRLSSISRPMQTPDANGIGRFRFYASPQELRNAALGCTPLAVATSS
jgi:hypothetical protein